MSYVTQGPLPIEMLDTQLREEDIDTKKYYAAQVFAFPNLSQRSGPRVGVFFSWEEVCTPTLTKIVTGPDRSIYASLIVLISGSL